MGGGEVVIDRIVVQIPQASRRARGDLNTLNYTPRSRGRRAGTSAPRKAVERVQRHVGSLLPLPTTRYRTVLDETRVKPKLERRSLVVFKTFFKVVFKTFL